MKYWGFRRVTLQVLRRKMAPVTYMWICLQNGCDEAIGTEIAGEGEHLSWTVEALDFRVLVLGDHEGRRHLGHQTAVPK